MGYVGAALCTLFMVAGIFLLFLSLPGTWLILITSAVWGFFSTSGLFTWQVYALLAALAVAGEIIEFFAGSIGAKRFGGSKKGSLGGIIGAIAGAVLGAPFFFGLGALAGALAGAFAGSFIFEKWHGMPTPAAIRASMGASIGRFGGFVAKLGIAVTMMVISLPRIWGGL